MNKIEVANTLVQSSDTNGLVHTIAATFGTSVKVRLPLGDKTLDTCIEDLEFSVRASNCLKRTGLMKIRDVVEAIKTESLPRIRNLGKTSMSEIKTKLLDFGYNRLTANEKKTFFLDMLEINGYGK